MGLQNIDRLFGTRGNWTDGNSSFVLNKIIAVNIISEEDYLDLSNKLKDIKLDNFDGIFIPFGWHGDILVYNKNIDKFSIIQKSNLQLISSNTNTSYKEFNNCLINEYEGREIILMSGLICESSFICFDDYTYVRTSFDSIKRYGVLSKRTIFKNYSFNYSELVSMILLPILSYLMFFVDTFSFGFAIAAVGLINLFLLDLQVEELKDFFKIRFDQRVVLIWAMAYTVNVVLPIIALGALPSLIWINLMVFFGLAGLNQFLWIKNTKRYLKMVTSAE